MSILNENQLRHLIKEMIAKETDKLKKEIADLYDHISVLRDELKGGIRR